jgi:hypothetical protein
VNRLAIAAVVVAFAGVAQADVPAPKGEATAKPAKPDEIADVESREANLESKEPRKGFTFAAAIGGDIMIGGDIGVGRGPCLSLRLGHVATRKTIITFELAFTSGLHKAATMSDTLTDSNVGLFVGAQRYTSRSFWVRAAGGLTVLSQNLKTDGSGGDAPVLGIGGLVGAGLDIARLGRYIPVISLEGFGMASASREGLKAQLAFGLGFAYY